MKSAQFSTVRRANCPWVAVACLTILSGCTASRDNPEVTFERGRILADRGQFDDAIPFYEKALKQLPERADIYYERGRAYENLNLYEKAVEDYARCLDRNPDFTQALNNKGVMLAKLERYADAAAEFGRLITQQPNDVLALRNRGLCYHDQGLFDEALTDYNKAIEFAANDPVNWFQRGNVFLEQTKLQEAIADYDKAIELDATYARAWMNRGVARFNLNERAAAVKDLQHAQELDDSIVLPAIDWLNADMAAETVVIDVSAAKPVSPEPAAGGDWIEVLDAAEQILSEKGFHDVTVVSAAPEYQCGRFTATKGDAAVGIYVAVGVVDSSEVILPAIPDQSAEDTQALLVLTKSEPDANYSVARFVEDWKPEPEQIVPTVVKVRLPTE